MKIRENNMFGIRELKERVAKLEEELNHSKKAVSFLMKHDRNEIVLRVAKGWIGDEIEICYTYNGEFKVATIMNWCSFPTLVSTENVNSSTSIIQIMENYVYNGDVAQRNKFYQLDKVANTLTDITETRKALLKEIEKKTTSTKSQNKKGDK